MATTPPLCPNCKYDLTGSLIGDACPACGRDVYLAKLGNIRSTDPMVWRLLAWVTLSVSPLLVFASKMFFEIGKDVGKGNRYGWTQPGKQLFVENGGLWLLRGSAVCVVLAWFFGRYANRVEASWQPAKRRGTLLRSVVVGWGLALVAEGVVAICTRV